MTVINYKGKDILHVRERSYDEFIVEDNEYSSLSEAMNFIDLQEELAGSKEECDLTLLVQLGHQYKLLRASSLNSLYYITEGGPIKRDSSYSWVVEGYTKETIEMLIEEMKAHTLAASNHRKSALSEDLLVHKAREKIEILILK